MPGLFDGVHRGHQAVIREGKRRAEKLGAKLAIMTLDRYPGIVFNNEANKDFAYLSSERKSLNFSNASESTFVTSFRLMRSSIRSVSRILSKNTSFRSTQSAQLQEATIRMEKCRMQTAATCRIWKAMPTDALRWSRFRICLMTEKNQFDKNQKSAPERKRQNGSRSFGLFVRNKRSGSARL